MPSASVPLSGPPTSSLVHALRAATAARHRALDRAIAFRDDTLTHERYVALLSGSLAVLLRLQPLLVDWFGSDVADRVGALRADLAALGEAGIVASIDVIPPRDAAEAHGCAYVVEGSALGGVVLAPIVERALSLPAGRATRYLRLHGPQTGAHWRRWLDRLDAFGRSATPADRASACAFACRTFDAYATAFRACALTTA